MSYCKEAQRREAGSSSSRGLPARILGVSLAVLAGASLLSGCATSSGSGDRLQQLAADIERNGDYRTAAGMYARMAEKTGDADDYRRLGGAWLRAGEPARADEAYRQALNIEPDDAEALLGLGSAQLELDRPGYAVQALSRAAPAVDSGDAWSRLGVAQAMTGNGAAAQTAFTRALRHAPDDLDYQSNLALAQALAGHQAQAVQQLSRTVESPLAQARHYRNLLLVMVLAGRSEEARRLPIPDIDDTQRQALIKSAERIREIPQAPLRARAMGFRPAQATI